MGQGKGGLEERVKDSTYGCKVVDFAALVQTAPAPLSTRSEPPGELGFYSVLECTGWISKPECGPGVDVPRI